MVSVTALPVLQFMCILCLHLPVDGQGNVPSCKQRGSKRVGELCFNYNSSPVDWYQAKTNCDVHGMTLAYVNSVQQIREILQEFEIENQVWIGASDENKEREFIWAASNEKATELDQLWAEGEPNNEPYYHGGDEDCASLLKSFYVNDAPCSIKIPYLCIEKSCPYNLEVLRILENSLTFSWKPGFNGGQPQTFSVTYQDLGTTIFRVAGTVTVPRVNQTSNSAVEYSVTGLSRNTPYKIFINASINNGKTACTTLTLITQTTGLPECPVNISILEESHDHVLLSWTPGQGDELPQTFTILAHNFSVLKNIHLETVPVGRVYTTNHTRVMYTVAHLSELTTYTFSIDVENNFGKRKCNDDFIQVTTTSDVQKVSFPAWLIFLLVFFPLVLAAGIVGFISYRRKVNTTLDEAAPKRSHRRRPWQRCDLLDSDSTLLCTGCFENGTEYN